MTSFVTLQDVKDSLRIYFCDDDPQILLLMEAATGAVINYLKSSADQYLDSGGDVIDGVKIPAEIQIATIFLVGILYRSPDNDTEGAFDRGYLPRPVTALLTPLRDPALA